MAPSTPSFAADTPEQSRPLTPVPKTDMAITDDLSNLQSEEQRRVLDVVAKVQKCGLKGELSFPQLVVCGDQSAGKSSVLEALTGVDFPRSDNLCTRYATEFNLRRAPVEALTIKVIPDENRPVNERDTINAFSHTIVDLSELQKVMEVATKQMGIGEDVANIGTSRAFSRDVLSITIEGPDRPQLTLVDLPGLIATDTRGVSKADVKLVEAITDSYITKPRTICLAVITASNDYANQRILTKVREVDRDGRRTLGIITKPDLAPAGSGSEKSFIELALNEDIKFELGWHVVKNRKFEDMKCSLVERNIAEDVYFGTSNWKRIPKESLGIDALRKRLSAVLFAHIKTELPKLRNELDMNLKECKKQVKLLGSCRSTPVQCKTYLSELSQEFWTICKAAVDGHYESDYFRAAEDDENFEVNSPWAIRRIRAIIQQLNANFSQTHERYGQKYYISMADGRETSDKNRTNNGRHLASSPTETSDSGEDAEGEDAEGAAEDDSDTDPIFMTKDEALAWVQRVLIRNRGKELIGNFNPLTVGELLREQATNWEALAISHVETVNDVCRRFLEDLLTDKCVEDVVERLWSARIEDVLDHRKRKALDEVTILISEIQSHPINYNHYYTETIAASRAERMKVEVKSCAKIATSSMQYTNRQGTACSYQTTDIDKLVALFKTRHEVDMEKWACSEVLDCLLAIYKVSQKVFVANITTQVIERHIVKGLETIFSPLVVNSMTDEIVEAIAAEPLTTHHRRQVLTDRITKLKNGQDVFEKIMGGRKGGNLL